MSNKIRSTFIETARLTICVPSMDDLEDQFLLQSNPEVMKHIGNGVRTKAEVKVGLQKAVHHFEKFKFGLGSVFEKSSQQFIGRAGLIHLGLDETAPAIEVGYALLPPYWRKGYATELASTLVEWGFRNLSIPEIVAVTKKENLESRKVLEKIGMTFVKETEYHQQPVLYYSIGKSSCQKA